MTNILVIEDESSLREEILDTLRFEGFEAIGADNGHAGVQLAREHLPDMILCDIMMPQLDGYGVLQALRQEPKTATIPIIFLTAKAARADIRQGMNLGADDYLTKPFTNEELLSAIDARLERHTSIVAAQKQAIEQAQKKLTLMVAHELRTPLTSVTMVQEIISRRLGQLSPRELQDLFDIMSSGSQRLNHLIEQMVFITYLETEALSQETVQQNGQPIQVWTLLTAAIDLARRFVSRRRETGIQLDERDREAVVKAEKGALKHALTELIANALAFSPEGSRVMVSQWQVEGAVWISVLDQGPGMERKDWERAMERFQQINRETQEQQGMGLGLPLAREIILAHGGTFELSSVAGKGTQVTISLPLLPI